MGPPGLTQDDSAAAGRGNTEGSPLASFKLSVVAPRSRLKVINSVFAEYLVSLQPLYPTIGAVKSPISEWDQSDLLVIEVPMLEFGKDEVHLAIQRTLIARTRIGKHSMLLVLPRFGSGSRGRHEKTEKGPKITIHHDTKENYGKEKLLVSTVRLDEMNRDCALGQDVSSDGAKQCSSNELERITSDLVKNDLWPPPLDVTCVNHRFFFPSAPCLSPYLDITHL